ncbi:hypothetical protein, partial, partial [Absidia glauca]
MEVEVPETELERCVRVYKIQQEEVDEKRQLVLDIFDNQSSLCVLPEGPATKKERLEQARREMKEAEQQLDDFKESFLRKFPHETTFGGVPASAKEDKAAEQAYTKMVKELPGLRFHYDTAPPMINKGSIHTEVPEFIGHFEQVFQAHRVSIERHFHEALSFCLSSSVLDHYETQRAAMEEGTQGTWALAKEWLTSFGETPANTIAKWQTLINLTYQDGESSASYFTRWRDALKKANNHKLSLEQVSAIVAVASTPFEWRRKFYDELQVMIKEDKCSDQDLLTSLIKLDNNLTISNKRSGRDNKRGQAKKFRVDPDEQHGQSSTQCKYQIWDYDQDKLIRCKEQYSFEHKQKCPIRLAKLERNGKEGPATHANATNIARPPRQKWTNDKNKQGAKKMSRAAKKPRSEGRGTRSHHYSGSGRQEGQRPHASNQPKVVASASLAKSKHAPRPSLVDEIAVGLYGDRQQSADDQY